MQESVRNGKKLAVEIKPERQRRSIDSNAYLWILCQKIAEVIGSTKDLVYRKLITDVGQFEVVPIRNDAVESFTRKWNGRGLGWHSEVESESKLNGYSRVICYFGSSVYDTKEMATLIDEAVSQARELGIETLPPDEIESMKSLWRV